MDLTKILIPTDFIPRRVSGWGDLGRLHCREGAALPGSLVRGSTRVRPRWGLVPDGVKSQLGMELPHGR
jgi:hypothetical protein